MKPEQHGALAPDEARLEVPFLDLGRDTESAQAELIDAAAAVIRSGRYLFGPALSDFETRLATRMEVGHAVGVSSGTDGLQIALMALGIGKGDEVITTPASFFATAKAIAAIGATPVFADIRRGDCNIDPDCVAAAITPRTAAILPVHLYGRPADMPALRAIALRHGLALVEDAAQAIGADPVAQLGDLAVFSFYPTKNLGACGDAGAVLTNDPALAERCRSLRFLGAMGGRDLFGAEGMSARMDDIQAAILSAKLNRLDAWQARRSAIAARYRNACPHEMLLAPVSDGIVSAEHLFVLRTPQRDGLRDHLTARGIGTQIHYRMPLHRQPAFDWPEGSLPEAEAWSREVLSLPCHPGLKEAEQSTVIAAVAEFATR